MVDREEHSAPAGVFWSGAITFGLVSIQVDLYSAHRPRPARLHLVDQNGISLHRRYFCPRDLQPVGGDELVRGYEVEEGRFIVVADEELEALEPKKSREIDMRGFVPVSEVDPVYFQHAYFLVPAGGVNKAYRLLAAIMEQSNRAGIATFVMKEREHLVAILAEGGILRAEVLRFSDEIRPPAVIGLPPLGEAPAELVSRLQQEIEKLQQTELDQDPLSDRHAHRLLDLVQRKLAAGEDVVEKEAVPAETKGAEIIDLMEIIKQRFAAGPKKDGRRDGKKNTYRKSIKYGDKPS